MDCAFPHQLFPTYCNSGPPNGVFRHTVDGWGRYDQAAAVSTKDGSSQLADWKFTTSHQFRGETWLPTEPVPVPLMSPKTGLTCPSVSPGDMDFIHHMQNFYLENYEDAFYSTSQLLGEHLFFRDKEDTRQVRDAKKQANMWRTNRFMERLPYKTCEYSYFNDSMISYGNLLYDVVADVPVDLLANLVEEELNQHRDKLQLNEQTIGGALAYIPFTQGSTGGSQHGCLLYPGKESFSLLKFHKVVMEVQEGKPAHLDTTSNKPLCFQLKGPIRQISSASLLNQHCVGVRSDYLCGVWRLDETMTPSLLKVVETREPASCINVSPHVLGEVLVASYSGAAHLWTVGKGMQKVREEDSNLYFNAQSTWRWCDFSGHPRVMVYADRTGAELTDIRTSPWSSHTLFRVGQGPDCKSGERVINTKYLGDTHTFHHLVTTQFSAYILDERVPGVPMLKWEHMMEYPPVFGHVLPGSSSSSVLGGASTTKVVLGSQTSQDLTLLQYSGGRAEACVSVGPPQTLLRPRDSLKHLPVQIPHRLQAARTRISQPAAGLTCIQKNGGGGSGGVDCIWVLQLTEAGDIFYQILEQQQHENDMPRPLQEESIQPQSGGINQSPKKQHPQPAAQTDTSAFQRKQPVKERTLLLQDGKPNSEMQQLVANTSSDEDIIGPTQFQSFVPETQECEHPQLPSLVMDMSRQVRGMRRLSGSSSEGSQGEGPRRRLLASWGLEVVVNEERDEHDDCDENLLPASQSTDKDIGVGTQETVLSVDPVEENTDGCVDVERTDPPSPSVQLSDGALAAWKRWLQKLMMKTRVKRQLKTQPLNKRPQTYRTVPTRKLPRHLHGNQSRDATEEQRVASLRQDIRESMAKGSVLVKGSTAELVPLPNPVDTEVWMDDLSERLTVSWKGEEEYDKWWQENLGMNKEAKMDTLRNKRRRQKEERRRRRAASGTSELSASFSSASGWSSSATGVDGWCDIDLDSSTGGFLSEQDFISQQEFMSQSSTLATHLSNTLAGVSERQEDGKQGQQQQLDARTVHVRSPDRPVEQSKLSYQENLDSLAPSQEESREPQNVTVDNVMTTNIDSAILDRSAIPALRPSTPSTPALCPSTPATPVLRPSTPSTPATRPSTPAIRPSTPALRPSSPLDSQNTLPSTTQTPIPRMGFSQPTVLPSFSLQSPKGVRVNLSQLQTPKRKKSRMGF